MGEVTEAPLFDELFEVLDERSPSIVESDTGDHPGAPGGVFDLGCDVGRFPHRLLAEDGLARLSSGDGDLSMQFVGCPDGHHVNVGMIDDGTPIVGRGFEPEVLARQFGSLGHVVGNDDEPRHEVRLWEVHGDSTVRTRMRLAHPTESDYADAD